MKEAAWGAEKDMAEWSLVPRQMDFHLWVVGGVSVWRRRVGDMGVEYHSAGVGKLWKLWALVGVRIVVRRATSHVRVRDCIVTVLYKYG
jgi:hypothetical protein